MKQFTGFTPKQQLFLLQRLGYTGSHQQDEMEAYMNSSPNISMKMGRYHELAQNRLNPKGMAEGGSIDVMNPDKVAEHQDPEHLATEHPNVETDPTELMLDQSAQTTATALSDPSSLVVSPDVQQLPTSNEQFIDQGTGQVEGTTDIQTTTVEDTQQATAATQGETATFDPTLVEGQVTEALEGVEAATADPTAKATVRGQLELLMEDFEGDATPPWASGAMREAMSVMQARGMGASSLAGAAIVNAAMEAAIGIASQDASIFASFEMKNLDNEQQMTIFKTQLRIQSILSDQAQINGAKQFNAASENQTNQFFANLETAVSQFNASQINAIRQFNAGETNVMEQFVEQMNNQRDMFNAQNSLVIAQANTQWRQSISTIDTAAINQANMVTAAQVNSMTAAAMDKVWQTERDLMAFAFASSESLEERNLQLTLQGKQIKDDQKTAIGFLVGRILFGL